MRLKPFDKTGDTRNGQREVAGCANAALGIACPWVLNLNVEFAVAGNDLETVANSARLKKL